MPLPNKEENMRFILILLLPTVICGFEWTPPQLVADVGGHCHHCRFGLDCFDQPWCIFAVSVSAPGFDTVKASCYTEAQWSEPISIYGGIQANAVGGFDVTRAKNGKLWVLTCEEDLPGSPPHITFYYDGSAWSDTFIIPPPGGVTYWHLAADSSGKVWATFDDNEDSRIWCDVCEDTIWSGPYVVCDYPGGNLPNSYITINPNGIRWVCGGTGAQIFLTYSDSTGAWTGNLIMGPNGGPRDIISDNEGNIWIAFFNEAERRIYTTYLDTNLQWSTSYQITQFSGEFQGFSKMAVDGDNRVWIVYDKNNTFYYRVWDGFEWSPEEAIVAPPASAAYHGDVFYDSVRNRIWILYLDGYPIGDIYATWTDPSSGIIESEVKNIKSRFLIFPNPVKDCITISIQNTEPKNIRIFDCLGCLIKSFTTTEMEIIWDCKNNFGMMVESGVYFLNIKTVGGTTSKKIIVL